MSFKEAMKMLKPYRKQEIDITNDLGKKMKAEAFEHGLKPKPHYFKEHGFYNTVSDALYDITAILQITNNSLLTIFVIVCKCAGAMAGLVVLDWRLSIFVAAIMPLKVWLNVVIRKRAEKHGKQAMDDNKGYNSWLANILSGIVDIKLWNLEKKTSAEYTNHVNAINESSKKLSLGGRDILKDFNLRVGRGEKVAVSGDNGSGKTTVVNLLLRLVDPDSGEILMDGVPVKDYNIEEYRQKFSVVTQEVHLFNGTVGENITLGKSAGEDMGSNSRLKFCTEAIENWEGRYEAQVGSEGAKLSGGERQKIALLRALHRKSEILVLDEPTSSYDKESDEGFNRFIQESDDYGFVFIVSHRKGIASYVDKVVEL